MSIAEACMTKATQANPTMTELSSSQQKALKELARRTGFGIEAVKSMLESLIDGQGGMAQFNHPEFGGHGQWMRGGMTMVSDMFNHQLKARVDALCVELAKLLASQPALIRAEQLSSLVVPGKPGGWWPSGLGQPDSSGAQNNVRYAYFAKARRLAIEVLGSTTVYDTLDHQIGGFSQQQSASGSLGFTSQHGLIDVATLPVVSGDGQQASTAPKAVPTAPPASAADAPDVFATIEKLAGLKDKGHLSAEEFAAKKAELLARL
jgi:hypothetical protein